jgi:glucokinase
VTTSPAPAPTIGIDVGGTKVLGVAVDAGGVMVAEHREPTPEGGEAVLATMLTIVEQLRARVPEVAALGAGVPGLVDRTGTLRIAPNLPGVVELAVATRLASATGLPTRVDNDATCALWGEHATGVARGADDVLLVTLGTGIGGGLLLDGQLTRGANGFAGEFGHMVVAAGGIRCPCGRSGCWERYASGSALGRMGREAAGGGGAARMVELAGGDPADVRGEHVTAAAAEGDAAAQAVVAEFASWFAIGLANLVAIVDVRTCVVGGGLVEAGDVLLTPIREAVRGDLIAAGHRPPVDIVAATLGEHAGAVGAAHLAREALAG